VYSGFFITSGPLGFEAAGIAIENMTSTASDDARISTLVTVDSKLSVLQYGRAVAAISVVLSHAAMATNAFVDQLPWLLNEILQRGYLGVDFFFTLSGFIIMHIHHDDPRNVPAAKRYITKRLRRIYIPYIPVSIGLIALYLAMPSFSASNRNWGLLTSLTLIPTGSPPALSVAWTLVHEMMFYCIFLASYFTRHFKFLIVGWVSAILLTSAIKWVPSNDVLRVFLAPINLEFVAGMAAALMARRLSPSWVSTLILLGVCGIVASIAGGAASSEHYRVWIGIFFAPLVLGLVLIERFRELKSIHWFVLLGDASYAIYLMHNPVISIAARLAGGTHSWVLALFACVTTGILIGLAYHLFYERPALRYRPLTKLRLQT
jgi:exopolysaccharide production protein ExoZ